ncbi:inorganic diphosphatase [Streptomyces sp. NPDC014748]|uniref:inorganic diphosphatase n=1 Tax=Streptomyces sp. NPDC014748 TaxID=3364905 RepID=UPI0037008DD1
MCALPVLVEATSGSSFTPGLLPEPAESWAGHPLLTGCAVGEGYVVDSLAPDGEPADALVLMEEPALPGRVVPARPVALLRVAVDGERSEVLVCVQADSTVFESVSDVRDLLSWHADERALSQVLARFGSSHAWQVLGWQERQAAEKYAYRARHDFEESLEGPGPPG